MAAKLTDDQWAAIRAAYEEDPTITYEGAADLAGENGKFSPPTKGRISQKAKSDGGWSKRGQLSSINEAAQRLADKAKLNAEVNSYSPERLAARSESERLRAEILTRHREEWEELDEVRRAALDKMRECYQPNEDGSPNLAARDEWTIAKMAAETAKINLNALEIKQAGERRSWGLDDPTADDKTGTTRVVLIRKTEPMQPHG